MYRYPAMEKLANHKKKRKFEHQPRAPMSTGSAALILLMI